jgi:hypothetical protein
MVTACALQKHLSFESVSLYLEYLWTSHITLWLSK